MPLDNCLSWLRYHILPMFGLWSTGSIFTCISKAREDGRKGKKIECINLLIGHLCLMHAIDWFSWDCASIDDPLPANKIRPINSFRPMLSKSMTIISNEHSRIFSHGTLKLNDSLNIGFSVHLNIGVFRFSMRLSPNWSQTLTYGSVYQGRKRMQKG